MGVPTGWSSPWMAVTATRASLALLRSRESEGKDREQQTGTR